MTEEKQSVKTTKSRAHTHRAAACYSTAKRGEARHNTAQLHSKAPQARRDFSSAELPAPLSNPVSSI